ncbi:MAG: UTP--glucose-1-phosphate uridylyltransferase [Gammaproteobacteria bacterium]|nr:UTP--glucose-1-phosphate uridylyltransferase [Gammaproteobacteria bacterium]
MPKQPYHLNSTERTLIAVLLIIVIFVSPMSNFWAALDAPWFSPYLAWAVAIFLSWLLQRHIKDSLDK